MAQVKKDTSLLDLISETWEPFSQNIKLTLAVPALLMFVPFVLVGLPIGGIAFAMGLAGAVTEKSAMFISLLPLILIGSILFALVFGAIRVGWTKIILALADEKETSFQDLKAAMPWFLNFVLAMFLVGLLTMVGAILFVIPGIIVAVRTIFAPFLVIDENLGPIEALQRSNQLASGYSWQILGFLVIYGIGNMIAGAIPILGIFLPVATMGFFDLALARIYRMRKL